MNPQHILPQVLLRSWPFPHGAGRIIDRFFSRLAFEPKIVSVRTTDGFVMNILPNELIGRHIYLTGEFDRSTVKILLELARPGDVLLDIGANVGYVSGCFLKNVPRSKIIAVEPQPQIVDLLQSNLKPFGEERYKLFPVGLSDTDGSGWMEICDLNRGASKVVDKPNRSTVEIALWSAKRLFASLSGNKIDLIKLDVEGHEERVLTACQPELDRLRPRAVFFESRGQSAAPGGSIGNIFRSMGYQVLGVKKRLTNYEFVPISSTRDCVYNDYLAVREARQK